MVSTIYITLVLLIGAANAFLVPVVTPLNSRARAWICSQQRGVRSVASQPLYGKRSIEETLAKMDMDDDDDSEGKKAKKEKIKLEPEVTIFEGGPDISETFVPAISIVTVIGIVPFAAALARQAWVKYTITSRRVRIVSGIQGKDETEIVYPDIKKMVFVYRFFGRCGDVVMELRDGSKLELRSLPDFETNYAYILSRTSSECQEASNKLPKKEA